MIGRKKNLKKFDLTKKLKKKKKRKPKMKTFSKRVNGEMTGKGVYTFANGDRCVGLFMNGKKEGPGTMFYENGIIFLFSLIFLN